MQDIMDRLTDRLLPLASKLAENKYLTILRDAFMLALPFTMFGSIVTVIINLPFFPAETKALFSTLLGNGVSGTMSIMTLFVTFGIGYYLAKNEQVEAVFGGAISLASFLILQPFLTTAPSGEAVEGVLSVSNLGAEGMFVGLISAFLSAKIYCWVTNQGWQIHMPESVPEGVAKSFASLIPVFVTLAIFVIINAIFTTGLHVTVNEFIYHTIQQPLTGLGSSLPATLIAIFFIQIFWFFGLHGQTIINSVMDGIWMPLMLENLAAYQANKALPHVISKAFMETFTVGLGGTGMTLIVVILMAFVMKSKQMREIGRIAVGPGIFNVNEPVIFGLPIVLNPIAAIPWIVTPIIVTTFNYVVMTLGIFPLPTGVQVPWTVPVIISGFLATNSWLGGLLQLIDMAIVAVIWYPFLKVMVRLKKKQ
ncbi:MAG: PTS cellobiose transporter subunit IIC [Aerococcus sp.]|nr:PTS cellobiose transporter subunit IIC [Aerococcus sp.]